MKRKTDKFDDIHFSSDRFFFADNQWYYYVRSYDGQLKTISGFNTKELAVIHCEERFTNKIDYTFDEGNKK